MPNRYIAPYSLSDFPIIIPSEGQFTVPVCTTPERYQKILNALFYYGVSQYDFDFDHLIDFLDASTRIVDGCVDFSEQCREIGLRDERISWFPENPFSPEIDPPTGYPFHPFTVVTGGTLGGIIAEFGLGFKSGDVFVDLTKLPTFSSWLDIASNYANMPRIQVNGLVGRGKVTFHLLNIVQGSRMLVVVDDVVDILHLQTIEVGKDAISFPPETQVDFLVEIPVTTDGNHTVALVIYPTVDVSAIPISFGGGFRNIELCGFGVSPMTDPCCPETNETLTQILNLLKGGATIRFDSTTQTPDFTVDCSPPEFGGIPDQTPIESVQWFNAICTALTRWIVATMIVQIQKMNLLSRQADVLSLALLTSPPAFTGQLEYQNPLLTVTEMNGIIDSDTAFATVVCDLRLLLDGRPNSFVEFKDALDELVSTHPTSTDEATGNLAFLVRTYGYSRVNYAVFARALDIAHDDVIAETADDCLCEEVACDDTQFSIIGLEGTVVTYLGTNQWRVQQSNYTIPDPVNNPNVRQYKVVLRDSAWRCFNIYIYSEAMSGYLQYNCAGVEQSGGGGGGGSGIYFNFFHNQNADYHAIDATMTLLCP